MAPLALLALRFRASVLRLPGVQGMLQLHSHRPVMLHQNLKSSQLLIDHVWRGKVTPGLCAFLSSTLHAIMPTCCCPCCCCLHSLAACWGYGRYLMSFWWLQITDFYLSQLTSGQHTSRPVDAAFVAPEVLWAGKFSKAADVYSCGPHAPLCPTCKLLMVLR